MHELATSYLLVSHPDPNNFRERLCDPSVPVRSRAGEFDGELFWWARAMYQTISNDVCKSRHMTPLPPSIAQKQDELEEASAADRVNEWFAKFTVPCPQTEASEWKLVKAACEDALGKIDGTVRAECGKDQKHQGRIRKTRTTDEKYFALHPDEHGTLKPRKLGSSA